ncbi:hypothetical protein J6590_087930 [Homalodisca vitripennis]|nr:hypothetical protein J6590_087930 [Homalodisca vitripennis]
MNNSFKILDESNVEIVDLKKKSNRCLTNYGSESFTSQRSSPRTTPYLTIRKEEFTEWFYCNVVTLPDCPSLALNSVIPSSTPSHNQSQSSPPQLDNNTHTTSCKVDTVKLVRCKGDKWKLVKSNSKRKRSKQTKLPRQEVSIECGNKYAVLSDIDVDDFTELNTTPGVCGTSKPAKELSVMSHSSVSVTDRNQPKEKNIHANISNVSDRPLIVNDISCNENLSCNELPLKSCLIIGDSLLRYSGKQCSDSGATIDLNPGARVRTIKQKLMSYLNEKPKVIYLNVGTNDVTLCYNGGSGYNGGCCKRLILDSMADLLYTVKTKFPTSKVFLNCIPIRRDLKYGTLCMLNEQIELMCFNFGVQYVDLNFCLRLRHLTRDGRYLNKEGNFLLGFIMHQILSKISAHKNETQSFEPGTPEPDTPTAPETKPYTPEPEPDTPALTSGNDSTPHPNPPS